jgi:hypothetical protein
LPTAGKFLPFFQFSSKGLPLYPDLLHVRGNNLPLFRTTGKVLPLKVENICRLDNNKGR